MAHQQEPLHVAYGAVAWSPASGYDDWSYCSSVAEAERAAESEEPGSTWVCWGSNTMLALAKGPTGAYGYGWALRRRLERPRSECISIMIALASLCFCLTPG